MKKRTKKISTTVSIVAATVLLCTITAFAAVCSGSSDGIHHYNSHIVVGEATPRTYTHLYRYGIDNNNQPIYRECEVTDHYSKCKYKCDYCYSINNDAGTHTHFTYATHSVDHN